jgi:hypothetical protein
MELVMRQVGRIFCERSVKMDNTENTKAKVDIYRVIKNKYTLSKIYFIKTTDAKSMSCVRMERKSHKVLI